MIDSRIFIAILATLITIGSVVYAGINEANRRVVTTKAFNGRFIEAGAIIFDSTCSPCHGDKGQGSAKAPALNTKEFFDNRIKDLGYSGTLPSYLNLTISGGRPAKSDQKWPQNMPTWSVDFGGPLRTDQIKYVVDFIMNWEAAALPAEEVKRLALASAGDSPEEKGKVLFMDVIGCGLCHGFNGVGGGVGPDLENVYTKGEDYIRESILTPSAVIAEGFTDFIMPQTFADDLTKEQITDIIAYLKSVNEQQ